MNKSKNPRVEIITSKGNIVIELYANEAPKTVKNFLQYVNDGFYDGTIFHRVIRGFMIQGGGFIPGMQEKLTLQPIKNEAGNGLSNTRGTIAMARTQDVDSGTSQFFINSVDNLFLDHKDDSPRGFGYCVFGKVAEGMNVVDSISGVTTKTAGHFSDVPDEDVIIITAKKI